jgi:hypothetical protein
LIRVRVKAGKEGREGRRCQTSKGNARGAGEEEMKRRSKGRD